MFLECAELETHVSNLHPKIWGCLYCKLKFRGPLEAKNHYITCDQKPKSSTELPNDFPVRTAEPHHFESTTPSARPDIGRQLFSHTPAKSSNYSCNYCHRIYLKHEDWKFHQNMCLRKNSEEERLNYKYHTNKLERSIRLRSHASEDGFNCVYCGAQFLESEDLNFHVNNTHPRKWGCRYCPLMMRGPAEAKNHLDNCDKKPRWSNLSNQLPPVDSSPPFNTSTNRQDFSFRLN